MTVAIPVSMKRGLFRADPFVILVDTDRTALIHIDRRRYAGIVAPHRHGTYLDRLAGTMGAFAEYADMLARQPLAGALAEHPGSVVIENEKVKSFRLYIASDSRRGRRDGHYTFEIVTARKKYRGIVDRGANVSSKRPALKEIFGERVK